MSQKIRLCVISRTHPRDVSPGSGLWAFKTAELVRAETLYVTKRLPGRYVEAPSHLKRVVISYWEPGVPGEAGLFKVILIGLGKGVGALWFFFGRPPQFSDSSRKSLASTQFSQCCFVSLLNGCSEFLWF